MFIHAVPDNRGKKDRHYCPLVEFRRINGVPRHEATLSFDFIPADRLPYPKAAFNQDDLKAVLEWEKHSQETEKEKCSHEPRAKEQ